jgi:hypothetical protein
MPARSRWTRKARNGKGDMVAQFRQVCENLKAIVTARAGQMNGIVKLISSSSQDQYKSRGLEIGAVYREYFGQHYPATSWRSVPYDDDCRSDRRHAVIVSPNTEGRSMPVHPRG